MSLNAVKMLGISVTISPKDKILEYLEKGLEKPSAFSSQRSAKQRKTFVIVTPNPEQIVLAQEDTHFAKILNRADVALPDGVGLVAAMRLLDKLSAVRCQMSAFKRIPGVEFMDDLAGLAAKRGYPIALIGGRAGVAVSAIECLRRKYPGLTGWAMDLPEIPIGSLGNLGDLGYLREKIRKTHTRIIFMGLGAPKQEYVIEKLCSWFIVHSKKKEKTMNDEPLAMNAIVLMSVGGSFDIISGRTPRAPSFVRTVGLEWFWRLVHEPWRWKRQLVLVKFLWLVIREKLASKG